MSGEWTLAMLWVRVRREGAFPDDHIRPQFMYSEIPRPRAYDINNAQSYVDTEDVDTPQCTETRECRQACESRHECQLVPNGRLEPEHDAAHVQLLLLNTGNSSIIDRRS